MSLTADDKERGYWRYILFYGRYQHAKQRCQKCDFLYLSGEASVWYKIPVSEIGWKHLGVLWTFLHPTVHINVPSESQILYHARQPEFAFLEYVELRAKSLY